MSLGKRSKARELALQTLYQADLLRAFGPEEREAFYVRVTSDGEIRAFAREIVDGTLAARDRIDERLAAVARNWSIARMGVVERNILRLATHEILDREEIPVRVSINEAVELAKRYAGPDSGGFVNGLLEKIAAGTPKAAGLRNRDPRPEGGA